MNPFFSIIIPVYNRENFISATINSVFNQTYQNFELIMVDDGSTDGTPKILQQFEDKAQIFYQNNGGPEAARNQGGAHAKGNYLVFLDSDDILLPHALATYNSIIHQFNVGLIMAKLVYFKEQSDLKIETEIPTDCEVYIFPDFLSKTVSVSLSFSIIVVQKRIFEKVRGLQGGDDLGFVMSIGTTGPCAIIKSPETVAYRFHGQNLHLNLPKMIEYLNTVCLRELKGEFPGGWRRSIDRYAYTGGIAWTWIKYAYRSNRVALSIKLLFRHGWLVICGALRKLYKSFRPCRSTRIAIIK